MYSLFARSGTLNYLALIPLFVILRLRLIVEPSFYVLADTSDQYTPLWNALLGHVDAGGYLWVFLGIAIPLLTSLIVSNISNRYFNDHETTALGAMFFLLFCGILRPSVCFHPAMIEAVLLAMSVDRMFSAVRKERSSVSIAWSFVYATLGALLWAKAVWFLPFLVIMMFVVRVGNGRTLTAAFLGMADVTLLTYTCGLVAGWHPVDCIVEWHKRIWATAPFWSTGWRSWTYLAILALTTFGAIMQTFPRNAGQTIVTYRQCRVAYWFIIVGVFLMVLPTFSYETQEIAAIGAALLLPQFFANMRSKAWQDGLTAVIFLVQVWLVWS